MVALLWFSFICVFAWGIWVVDVFIVFDSSMGGVISLVFYLVWIVRVLGLLIAGFYLLAWVL